MEEKITVVLPTYNGSQTIEKSINSILNQTYQNWELILVNDCSTDNTLEILNEYALKDSRIKVISNQTNQKLPRSLNIGFREATGEYLTWTSDDNAYHNDAFEVMVGVLQNNRKLDFVYADFDIVDLEGKFLRSEYRSEPDTLRYNNTVGACFLYRKTLADKIGEYDPDLFLAEDYEYWIRAYLNGNMKYISKTLYDYGWNDKSLTATNKSEKIAKVAFAAKEKHFDELLARCLNQNERNTFYYGMLQFLYDSKEYKAVRRKYYKLDTAFARTDRAKRFVTMLRRYCSLPIRVLRKLRLSVFKQRT